MEVNPKVHKLRDNNHKASVEGLAIFLHQILEDRKNYIRAIENRTKVTRQRSKVLAKELHQIMTWRSSTENCCAIEKPSPECLHRDSGLENHFKDEGTSSNHGSSTRKTRSWGYCHVREILAHCIYVLNAVSFHNIIQLMSCVLLGIMGLREGRHPSHGLSKVERFLVSPLCFQFLSDLVT